MAEPVIPTMECPDCAGMGRGRAKIEPRDRGCPPWPCPTCDATGRIQRPPLTPDQVAALPDGARVVVEWRDGAVTVCRAVAGFLLGSPRRQPYRTGFAANAFRTWLAEDADV